MNMTIDDLLERAAVRWPDRVAISDTAGAMSYRELRRESSFAAARLHTRNIGPGSRVAVLATRSHRTLVALYSVWRSGAAAVLMDADWPAPIIAERCLHAGVHAAITVCSQDVALPCPTISLSELTPPGPEMPRSLHPASDVAYVVFTSGTLGNQRAVAVSHDNVLHYSAAIAERLQLGPELAQTFGHTTTFAADLGHTAIFAALQVGGACAVMSATAARDPIQFWSEARELRLDWLKTTPSHFRALIAHQKGGFPSLKGLILGGELLRLELARQAFDHLIARTVVNHYGPSETTIGTACHVLRHKEELDASSETVPIGQALGASVLTLINESGQAVPPGVEGELVVAGPGVALGYLQDSASWAARIIRLGDRPDSSPAYRTGDICVEVAPGVLQFRRRRDQKLKVRGFMVDPPTIAAALRSLPDIADAEILVRPLHSDNQIVAAVVPRPDARDLTAAKVKAALADKVMPFAVPSLIAITAEIPRNANGKADLRQLFQEVSSTRQIHETGSGLAEHIRELWSIEVGNELAGIDSDVRDLGADSIAHMRMLAKLRAEGLHLSMTDLLSCPTPRQLADRANTPVTPVTGKVISAEPERRLSIAQSAFFRSPMPDRNLWNQAILLRSPSRIDAVSLARAATHVTQSHSMLRQAFRDTGELLDAVDDVSVFGMTSLPAQREPARETLRRSAAQIQQLLSLQKGILFRVQLFTGSAALDDHILLVAHHLAVDLVSWRIILDHLADSYLAFTTGRSVPAIVTPDFWALAALQATHISPAHTVLERLPLPKPADTGQMHAWIAVFDESSTTALAAMGASSHSMEARLLIALLRGLGDAFGRRLCSVDVERHARSFGDVNGTETVGWFTRNVRVTEELGQCDPSRPVQCLDEGVYTDTDTEPADISLNFIGTVAGPRVAGIEWRPAPEIFGPLRCLAGDSQHALKVSARIAERRLVVDLVANSARITADTLAVIGRGMSSVIAASVARSVESAVVEHALGQSTSGLLYLSCFTGDTVETKQKWAPRAKQAVVLTGATGFLGVHILHELLGRDCRVLLLIRGRSESEARKRVVDNYCATFDTRSADILSKVHVMPSDLEGQQIEAAEVRGKLGAGDITIIHAAAMTRLFASEGEHLRANVRSVEMLLRLAKELDVVAFHHVSSLAVAGRLDSMKGAVFSEHDLNIGQSFLTPYERSKFDAERVISRWRDSRHSVQVSRSGHLAAHSQSGRFQRNIGDNRIFQVLRSYIALGCAPDLPTESLAFSFVDVVARAVTALALSRQAGTFHIESPHSIPHAEIVEALCAAGYAIEVVPHRDYIERLDRESQSSRDPAILAAAMWARRPSRNVVVSMTRSLQLLAEHGITFPRADPAWFRRLINDAIERQFFPIPRSA